MSGDSGNAWWVKICSTVDRLGHPRWSAKPAPFVAYDLPPSTIDLHGMTVQDAYHTALDFLAQTPYRKVVVITGKSGTIRQEFPEWLARSSAISYSELNGGGAFEVVVGDRRLER